jgi:hypothetical protein
MRELLIEKYIEPNFVDEHGTKYWYNRFGELHRTNGPAVEWPSGTKEWFIKGQRHRTNGPAVEYSNGDKEWYIEDKRHRINGPAIECADGDKVWYIEDKRHRTNGPAVECADGDKYWYIEGIEYTIEAFNQKIKKIWKLKKKKEFMTAI